jgi:hypothetical protein
MATSKGYDVSTVITSYTGTVRVPVTKASALAAKLLVAAPADLSAEQRAKLQAVQVAGNACDDVLKARQRVGTGTVRTARLSVVTAWSSFDAALGAFATLPLDVSPLGKDAAMLRESIFGEAETFIQLDGAAAWSASKRLLERIEEEGLEARATALGLSVFVTNARRANGLLGEAIGGVPSATATAPEPTAHALMDARARFRSTVTTYARALSADVVDDDSPSIERFLRALSPIDEVRTVSGSEDSEADQENREDEANKEDPYAPGGPFLPPDQVT